KSRLRFPSKKKKEEPEPEPERDDFAPAPAFRDFRKGKTKTQAREAFEVKAAPPPPEPEPAMVPDIPRDITPEELDALSALAAKLDGPASVENTAPLAEKTDPVEAPAAEVAATTTEVETPAAVAEVTKAEEKQEEKEAVETPAPLPAEMVEVAAPSVEAPALAVEAKKEAESPVEHVEPASEVAAVVAPPAAVVADEVNTALLTQEPAPVDRDDEPRFASAATEVEPATEDRAEEKIADKPVEELQAEMPAPPAPVAETAPEPMVEELAPSDVELAEALRLLTPATGHADVPAMPSPETLVAASQLPPEEAARNAAAGPRWVAEPVAMSSEEAAISLEAEMFRTFAAKPTATPAEEIQPARITGVQAIAAAVENRLAEAGITAATAVPEPEHGSAERGVAEHRPETTAAETPVAEAPAEIMAAVPDAEISSEARIEPEIEKESPAKKIETEPKDSSENVAEEEPGGATFANAVDWEKIEATAAVADEDQDLSSEDGGQESMSTDGKSKGKWRQIHTAPANAAAKTDVVEAAKHAAAEEAPKVMAAAAAEGTASATDASAIASIVDSVLADLRPRIVEEIAKKLAGK